MGSMIGLYMRCCFASGMSKDSFLTGIDPPAATWADHGSRISHSRIRGSVKF